MYTSEIYSTFFLASLTKSQMPIIAARRVIITGWRAAGLVFCARAPVMNGNRAAPSWPKAAMKPLSGEEVGLSVSLATARKDEGGGGGRAAHMAVACRRRGMTRLATVITIGYAGPIA